MRTTVDLPTPLFRRAKARAAERGETLRDLFQRAVEAEVDTGRGGTVTGATRVKLPLFGDPNGPKTLITNTDIERMLAAQDAAGIRPTKRREKKA
jgi:hypothetical protein